ncbi:MAG: S4 domain-containing protein, partial [Eubacterium sp.]|nr:S4 domain-containing protein [Eubacterium sp.]
MDKYEFIIDESMAGTRLDVLLSKLIEEHSRSYHQKNIENGCVFINGKECTAKKYKVEKNDVVEVKIPEAKQLDIEAEDIPLHIVYEDDDVLVVDKPAGMVVHPAAGNYNGTLVNAIMYHCGDRLSSINGEVRPGIVHRI